MGKWEKAAFDKVIYDCTKYATKIKKEEYLSNGTYPIVDQGKEFIAGYTNVVNGIYNTTPLIVFGDHTRIFKYIDFSLFLGADGVKLLKTDQDRLNTKFAYYYLSCVKIPDTGYNRHYKWLKETEIPLPPLSVQRKIANVLDRTSTLIEKRKAQMDELDLLIKSQFIEMFGHSRKLVPLKYYISFLQAGKSLAGTEECENKVLCTGSVSYDYFNGLGVKSLPLDYLPIEEHLVKDGDVLISRMNTLELVGAAAYVFKAPDKTYLPDRLWKAIIKPNNNPLFIWQILIQTSTKDSIRQIAGGTSGSMKNISKERLLGINVPQVDLDKQNEFAAFVQQIDKSRSSLQQSLEKLELNYKSLMQKCFRGEIF